MAFGPIRMPASASRAAHLRCVRYHLGRLFLTLLIPETLLAQLSYVARFRLEKENYLLGEPIFVGFTIQNTGRRTFVFSYRTPHRVLNEELDQEPRFAVREENGGPVPGPTARPCSGGKGSVVYGSVTLPPGHTHAERWLLNQWARFSHPGRYRVRAARRLPLLAREEAQSNLPAQPAAFALAINELHFELIPATEPQLERAFQPHLELLSLPESPDFAEAVLAVTTLPRPAFLEKLVRLAVVAGAEHGVEREQALQGLARLGTSAAWQAILEVARSGRLAARASAPLGGQGAPDGPLRAHAILLLAQKGDVIFLRPLIDMLSTAPTRLRGDILHALGYFRHPLASQVLFENLRSPNAADRVNAILGLRNLESREAIPALIAMLRDSDSQVRQVAHFALLTLTNQQFVLAGNASALEAARVADQWRAWWREVGGNFNVVRQPPCRDW